MKDLQIWNQFDSIATKAGSMIEEFVSAPILAIARPFLDYKRMRILEGILQEQMYTNRIMQEKILDILHDAVRQNTLTPDSLMMLMQLLYSYK